jgi:hypothetical protein
MVTKTVEIDSRFAIVVSVLIIGLIFGVLAIALLDTSEPPPQNAVIVNSQVKFYYDNGTWFTHPGTYTSIVRSSNVWYFSGNQYNG